MAYEYQFPAYKVIPHDMEQMVRQLESITSEMAEVQDAFLLVAADIDNEHLRHEFVTELMDVIHATETALRAFDQDYVDKTKAMVIHKNKERGYYDGV